MKRTVVALLLAGVTVAAGWFPGSAQGNANSFPEIEGLRTAVGRTFGPSGFRLVGTLALLFTVTDFENENSAAAGMPQLGDQLIVDLAEQGNDTSGPKSASVRPLGDERIAYAGTLIALEEDDSTFDEFMVAALVVREGVFVHFMYGAAIAGDPLADLAAVAEKIIGRQPGGDVTSVGDDGVREGGLWDLLPRIEDLPEGFVLEKEEELAPVDERQDQTASPRARPTSPAGSQ